eukprot:scaffold124517_cov31-Tisochrysis_lutea.AAC.2
MATGPIILPPSPSHILVLKGCGATRSSSHPTARSLFACALTPAITILMASSEPLQGATRLPAHFVMHLRTRSRGLLRSAAECTTLMRILPRSLQEIPLPLPLPGARRHRPPSQRLPHQARLARRWLSTLPTRWEWISSCNLIWVSQRNMASTHPSFETTFSPGLIANARMGVLLAD